MFYNLKNLSHNRPTKKMQKPNIPSTLPLLPGMTYADPTITRYHKTQILGLQNGIITGK